ncbi:MAG: hypothetical protein WCI74_16190, partial [Actinomycetes bacterium]
LSGFPFVAGLTFALFRWLRMNRWLAVLLALSFALLPWHFWRLGHTFFATYTAIPLGVFVVAVVASRKLDERDGQRRWVLPTLTAIAAIVVGASGVYYALFITLLLVVILVCQLVAGRPILASWRSYVASALIPVTLMAILVFIKLSSVTSSTGVTVERKYNESVQHGGALASLFTISGDSLLARNPLNKPLVRLGKIFSYEGVAGNNGLGVLAVTVTVLLVILLLAVGAGKLPKWLRTVRKAASFWPALMIFCVLMFVTTGVGAIFSNEITFEIRAWGRLSIVIIMVSLITLGLIFTPFLGKLAAKRVWIPPLIVLPILLVFLADAATMRFRIDTAQGKSYAAELQAYTAQGVAKLGSDCAVLELPVTPYPESGPVASMVEYSQLWPYLYSNGWKYSYGGLKGTREGDWALSLSADPAVTVKQAKAAGFCAVQVSRSGFADPEPVIAQYTKLLGAPVATAANEWVLFSLAAVNPAPYTRSNTVDPVAVTYGKTYAAPEFNGLSYARWGTTTTLTMLVKNYAQGTAKGIVSMALTSPPCSPTQTVSVKIGDVDQKVAITNKKATTVSIPISAAGGAGATATIKSTEPVCTKVAHRRLTVKVADPGFVPTP